MHESSLARMRDVIGTHLKDRRGIATRILDVGSLDVNGTYRHLFDEPEWDYVGLDMVPGPGVDVVVRRPYRWREIRSSSFDVVVSGQAFEHIEFPWMTILEVVRVLRPGGIVVLVVPSSGPEQSAASWSWSRIALALTAGWFVARNDTS